MKRGWIGVAALLAGCSVDAFCLDCREEDASADGGTDAASAPHDASPRDAGTDAAPEHDGCVPAAAELCNERDDDCDGLVDEDIDLASDDDNCGECGLRCAPPHAFGACEGGACVVTACDVGFLDLDEDPSNGCEYRCLAVADDDVICDLSDDDCDGAVDEDVDLGADAENCGSCGRVCAVPHGEGRVRERRVRPRRVPRRLARPRRIGDQRLRARVRAGGPAARALQPRGRRLRRARRRGRPRVGRRLRQRRRRLRARGRALRGRRARVHRRRRARHRELQRPRRRLRRRRR
ncbi:MAG: hypothetical protein M5U28_15335 [Sandaracinaceae bacterium]|nr:hypothetical protein [Sandaracinaceae bacterium]